MLCKRHAGRSDASQKKIVEKIAADLSHEAMEDAREKWPAVFSHEFLLNRSLLGLSQLMSLAPDDFLAAFTATDGPRRFIPILFCNIGNEKWIGCAHHQLTLSQQRCSTMECLRILRKPIDLCSWRFIGSRVLRRNRREAIRSMEIFDVPTLLDISSIFFDPMLLQ